MQRTLVNLLNRVVGPDDLFAVMTPDMSAEDISFARGPNDGGLPRDTGSGASARACARNPVEQHYLMCYPDKTRAVDSVLVGIQGRDGRGAVFAASPRR